MSLSYLDVAVDIAREAGKMIKSKLDTDFVTEEKSSSFDVVTEIDKASEKLIRDRLREAFPDHKFLGEEESFQHETSLADRLAAAAEDDFVWIVDPIDGTSNFVQRIPGFTVSIALACKGELTVGVIYDPCRDDMYYAEKSKGAFLNGKPIRVAETDGLSRSVVSTGFPSDPQMREAVFDSLREIGSQSRTVRALGSAACHLAYVAAGKLHAFWEYGLNAWDIAAGVLLIQEAGGTVSDAQGNPYSLATKHIVGSNKGIHESLIAVLKPLGL